jgi:hypothetical protein
LDYFYQMMFKIFSREGQISHEKVLCSRRIGLLLCAGLALLLASGCSLLRPKLPPVNLKEPGWTVHEGQAVWHRPSSKIDLAGEVLVATRADGSAFVQFTKSPFPLIEAQAVPGKWTFKIPPENKSYGGRGKPPKRLIWLFLPRALAGQLPPENWTWRDNDNRWNLENHVTGEALEGYFNQ